MALPHLEVKVSADTQDAVSGLDRVEDAARDTGRAVDRMAASMGRSSRRLSQVTNGQRKFGSAIQNVSFQVGDFATQVGAGTAASVALGQQLPQLLGGFGILGAAMGAVAAIAVPLTRSLVSMTEGAKLTSDQFGSLEPAIIAVADAAKAIKPVFGEAMTFLAENIDRVLITAGSLAALMAGKWVAGFVAARIATMSVAGAMGVLRTAIIRTGFGALIIGLGELIHQLVSANSWVRKLAIRLDLISASGAAELTTQIATLEAQIQTTTARLDELRSGATNHIGDKSAGINALSKVLEKLKIDLAGARSELKALEDAKAAAGGSITLLDFSKDKDGKDVAKAKAEERAEDLKKQREHLEAGLQAIRESQLTEKQELFKHLLDKRAILQEAFDQDMITQQERDQLMRDLQAEHNQQLAQLDQKTRDDEASKKSAGYQQIYNMTKGSLGDQLSAYSGFFQNLGNTVASGNQKVLAAMKIFASVEALINAFRAFNQVLADPQLPWYAKVAAAAGVLAAGLQTVTSIKSAASGGGGGGSRGGGASQSGQAGVAPPSSPLQVRLHGLGPADSITGSQLSTLLDRLDDEAGDRGLRLLVAA